MAKLKQKKKYDDASSSSSSSSFALQTSFLSPDSLIDQLYQIGFDAAAAFVARHDPERIALAIEYAKSKPRGKIQNLPGFIRYLVEKPGKIPAPLEKKERDKYVTGKYGHIVKR